MTRALTVALVFCAANGCTRYLRPEMGPERSVDTGVPVVLGTADSPPLDWDFGDGQTTHASQVQHAFARPGAYVVRALHGTEELARVRLDAVARPILRAIPENADGAFCLTRIRGKLEPAIDFAERLVGPDSIQGFLEGSVLIPLALENPHIEAEGGIGLFTVPDFRGLVGLIASRDPGALIADLEQRFARMGARVAQDRDGSLRVHGPAGEEIALVADRGYVYLIVPQKDDRPGSGSPDPQVAVATVRRSRATGLEAAQQLAGQTAQGGAAFLFLDVGSPHQTRVRTLVATGNIADRTLSVDGLLHADGPLWNVASSPVPKLLDAAPNDSIGALSLSVTPSDVRPLLLGLLSAPGQQALMTRVGLAHADVEQVLSALAGDLALLAYFDADAFFRHVARSMEKPSPRGTVLLEAGLVQPKTMEDLLRARLVEPGLASRRETKDGRIRFVLPIEDQPDALVEVARDRLSVSVGEPLHGELRDVGAALRERFGDGVFGQGHVSGVAEVGLLLRQLEGPVTAPGVPSAQLTVLQTFAAAFVRQLTPIDAVFFDIAPTAEGARLRGSLSLRR
jgi:hypothetical protein